MKGMSSNGFADAQNAELIFMQRTFERYFALTVVGALTPIRQRRSNKKAAQTRTETTDRAVERGKKGALGGNPEQLNEASQAIACFEPYLNQFFWAVEKP